MGKNKKSKKNKSEKEEKVIDKYNPDYEEYDNDDGNEENDYVPEAAKKHLDEDGKNTSDIEDKYGAKVCRIAIFKVMVNSKTPVRSQDKHDFQ